MADFCRQCSIDLFGQDNGDLADLAECGPDEGFSVICEGCGFILVNNAGECIQCDLKAGQPGHGAVPHNRYSKEK